MIRHVPGAFIEPRARVVSALLGAAAGAPKSARKAIRIWPGTVVWPVDGFDSAANVWIKQTGRLRSRFGG